MTDQNAPIVLPPKTDQRIFDPMEHVTDEEISPIDHILYADQDVDLLVWWADPGESHLDIHKHPHSAHVYFIVQGEGEALLGNGVWKPVRAGHVIVNPREKVHALRNTMASGRLVWASATTEAAGDYIMIPGTEDED
jgi:mannose-6-phosphate isomerase-like protein (cupin superfamily)